MCEMSELESKLKSLSARYVENEMYEFFEEKESNQNSNVSSFWNTKIGYVDKYDNVAVQQ